MSVFGAPFESLTADVNGIPRVVRVAASRLLTSGGLATAGLLEKVRESEAGPLTALLDAVDAERDGDGEWAACPGKAGVLVLHRWLGGLPRPLVTRAVVAKVVGRDGGVSPAELRRVVWSMPAARRMTLALLVLLFSKAADAADANGATVAAVAVWLGPLLFHPADAQAAVAARATAALVVFAEGIFSDAPALVAALPTSLPEESIDGAVRAAGGRYAEAAAEAEADDAAPAASVHSGASPAPPALPPGWTAHYDDNYGRYFYSNEETHETSWTPPLVADEEGEEEGERAAEGEECASDGGRCEEEGETGPSPKDSLRAVRMALAAIGPAGEGGEGSGEIDVDTFKAAVLAPGFPVLAGACQSFSMASANDFVRLVVELFTDTGDILELVGLAIKWELDVTLSAGTLFRGNSMSTKLMVAYTRRICGPYLEATFGPVFRVLADAVEASGPNGLEIDPSRTKAKAKVIKANIGVLHDMAQLFLDAIFTSIRHVPREMREIAHMLHAATGRKFPEMRSIVVGGYVFLRIVCPFLNAPTAFEVELDADVTEPRVRAALLLISKTLQNLANGVRYTTTKAHLMPLNEFIDANVGSITRFFDDVAVVPRSSASAQVGLLSREAEASAWADLAEYFASRGAELGKYAGQLAELDAADEGDEANFGTLKLGSELTEMLAYTGGPVFGATLQQLLMDDELAEEGEQAAGGRSANVPSVLWGWLEWLGSVAAHSLDGVFERNPPFYRVGQLHRLREVINMGARPTFDADVDPPENVAWLVKSFFNELADPLFSARVLAPLLAALVSLGSATTGDDAAAGLAPVVDALGDVPEPHLATAFAACELLASIAASPDAPSSTAASLGAVFGPVWLPPPRGQVLSGDLYTAANALAATLIAFPGLVAPSPSHRAAALARLAIVPPESIPLVGAARAAAASDAVGRAARENLSALAARISSDLAAVADRVSALATSAASLRTESELRAAEQLAHHFCALLDSS